MNERDYVLAKQAGFVEYELEDYTESGNDIRFSRFAELIRADEREAIAQMFEYAPALVEFARNDQGGCIMCGFTPEWVVASIRARGEA